MQYPAPNIMSSTDVADGSPVLSGEPFPNQEPFPVRVKLGPVEGGGEPNGSQQKKTERERERGD